MPVAAAAGAGAGAVAVAVRSRSGSGSGSGSRVVVIRLIVAAVMRNLFLAGVESHQPIISADSTGHRNLGPAPRRTERNVVGLRAYCQGGSFRV